MPYRVNSDLPPSVRNHLPDHAQDIYREAFNHAFAAHAGLDREKRAHMIAWAAVKRSYVKAGGIWVQRYRANARPFGLKAGSSTIELDAPASQSTSRVSRR